ncbi:Guanosine polyphosphate pyrophosphohydrolases/synthetases [Mycobacteroides abscessus subsp. abscessus]|uniref:hypothetical protein n=1 Tax=Mycobacteroides abscessus TaxID=36809 RepID=UPI00092B814E|nr:hypothetical protein [Mycobacteroides abscessus]SHU65074.1 Guanosine polyphosphate pyrophosphohydrolases/synthetases [Mycobacteroides abscessus subsp. abscessus]
MHYDTLMQQVDGAKSRLEATEAAASNAPRQSTLDSTAKLTHPQHTPADNFASTEKFGAGEHASATDGTTIDLDNAETLVLAASTISRLPGEAIDHTADRIASAAHRTRTTAEGIEHISYLRRVAQNVQPNTADYRAAALLHDILETTSVTEDSLALQGIPPRIIAAVKILSRDPQISDDQYYTAIRRDTIALAVKLAQIADSTDPARLSTLAPSARQRLIDKYAHTRLALLGERPGTRTW